MAVRESFDFVIVGSGGGGLVAALAAADAGLRPVVIEKQAYIGGSTAMSGGIIWMPNNPLMQADGVADSLEDGLTYLHSVVGTPDQGSSVARRTALLTRGPEMIAFLQRRGLRLIRCAGYADYYDDRPGGNAVGRAVEGAPWDSRVLGSWQERINLGLSAKLGMVVMTNEIRHLPVFARSPRGFLATTRIVARTYLSRLRRRTVFTCGMSLIGQLTKMSLDAGISIWLDTPVRGLVVQEGRIVGVRATRDGDTVEVRADKGVLLAAGGFERNATLRRKYGGSQPNEAQWTRGNLGNTGEVLETAIGLGARTDHLDEAIWTPAPRTELASSGLAVARQLPRTIYVNQHGRRFTNESNSYVEVGQALYANDALPAWLIFDDTYRRRYPWASGMPRLRHLRSAMPGRMPAEWISNGWIKKADTVADLARLIDLNPDVLVATVDRFNRGAAEGKDPDFGRGESRYNRVLGDPGNRPNPALGPIDTAPFYATEIFPGDVGTSGGVITDEHGRVLGRDDNPIPGLYATGNMSASVMGRTYPGAGASIANTTTFGYLAALHAAS